MKKLFCALSLCLTPVAAMADNSPHMFTAPDNMSDANSALFKDSIYALRDVCQETNDSYMIAICDDSDVAIERILEKNICLDLEQISPKPFNACQPKAAVSISTAIQYQFNEHILNGGDACSFSDEYQCFDIGGKVFAFRNYPA